LLDNIIDFFLAPNETQKIKNVSGTPINIDAAGPLGIFVYGLFSDPRAGDIVYFKVVSGKIESGLDLINANNSQSERFGQLFIANGKNRIEVESMVAGDLGSTVKLKTAHINDTLHLKGKEVKVAPIVYPNPKVRTAVVPVKKGEEEKVGMGLNALHAEDPTFVIQHSQELRQIILLAQGELHLGVAKSRLENRYKVEAKYIEPRVPYRETIQKPSKGSYRHKKQSGGAGQFAEVHMMLEPWSEGLPYASEYPVRGKEMIDLPWGGKLEYVNSIVGGVIDQRFMPAILKGVMEKMEVGPLTGSYVRDIRVTIFDGKMHPVDSNETAFKIAGTMVFKENFVKSDPKLLEPIYIVEIKVPDDFVGDVMSDLPSRRGVILGIESEGRYQKIKARMPLAEVDKYSTALRSMTQARATFSSEFAEYQQTPPNIQIDLVEAYKKHVQEEVV
jgi:elongation factor G